MQGGHTTTGNGLRVSKVLPYSIPVIVLKDSACLFRQGSVPATPQLALFGFLFYGLVWELKSVYQNRAFLHLFSSQDMHKQEL